MLRVKKISHVLYLYNIAKILPNYESADSLYVQKIKKQLIPHFTSSVTPKRVTSGGAHLRGLAVAPALHSFEETSQGWRHYECFDRLGNRTPESTAMLLPLHQIPKIQNIQEFIFSYLLVHIFTYFQFFS